ncbi:MAG TPA: hypothetical protein VJV79_01980 [Polyangiaceae bacterium]|nr:hypothetical protein [Polyangiaceae bacterium]
MKSIEILGWAALANACFLAACGGVSSIGNGNGVDSAGMGTGGSKASGSAGMGVTPKGGSGNGKAGSGTGASLAGTGPGMATGSAGSAFQPCKSKEDCPAPHGPCQVCPDGTRACNVGYCDSATGTCQSTGASCERECTIDMDCPVRDIACVQCSNGTQSCPTSICREGVCQDGYQGCGGVDPCATAACGSPCSPCTDGAACDDSKPNFCAVGGKCQPGPPDCSELQCHTAMDCGTPPPVCIPCIDGSCATIDCVSNKCAMACPSSNLQCKYAEDCVMLNVDPCTRCPSGSCAVPACLQNACELVCPVN